jgi:hypothetical protein
VKHRVLSLADDGFTFKDSVDVRQSLPVASVPQAWPRWGTPSRFFVFSSPPKTPLSFRQVL